MAKKKTPQEGKKFDNPNEMCIRDRRCTLERKKSKINRRDVGRGRGGMPPCPRAQHTIILGWRARKV